MMNGAVISLSAKRHTLTASSTCHDELIEFSIAVNRMVGFRNIMAEMGLMQEQATTIYQDNEAAIQIALNRGALSKQSPVQAYLDTLSLSQVIALKKDVESALKQCQDSNRHMVVYSGGDDLARRIREQCFAKDGTPLRPHKLKDSMQRLHERLGCHSQHSIPIGFFYAKWCEKLHFHLARANRLCSPSITSSTRTRTPSPTPAPVSSSSPSVAPTIASSSAAIRGMSIEEAEAKLNDIREKRAAIFVETKDGLLTKKEIAVFWYREGRRRE
jgi:hypothetical protein